MNFYMLKYQPVLGKKFGKLTPIEVMMGDGNGMRLKSICDCGNTSINPARAVIKLAVMSCGCIINKHGEFSVKNDKVSTEYRTWDSMRTRCNNENAKDYYRYGGRGITVCDRWGDYRAFLADMGRKPTPSHSIDRIDNDGNYEPSNCKWSTPTEQSNNRRELANKIHPKECETCKKVFKPHTNKARYCSHMCHGATRVGKKLAWHPCYMTH